MTIDQVINLIAALTLFEMMVAIGLGVTFADVLGVARNGPLAQRLPRCIRLGVRQCLPLLADRPEGAAS